MQVYDKDADANKEATFKLARDTKNPTAFEKERHLGTYRTTQSMAFAPPPEVKYCAYSNRPHSLTCMFTAVSCHSKLITCGIGLS